MLMSTESPYHCPFVAISLKYDFKHILNDFIHVYSPRAGKTTPWGQNFYVNRNSLSLCTFVASLKKTSSKSDFLPFFMCFFSHVYSLGQGQTTHWEQKIYDNRKAFSLCPYVASFKMISLKSDFIHIFNDFIHVYSPRARADKPLGTNFWCQQKALITSTICCKFQTNLFDFWFYTHFLMFFHMYTVPGQGQATLCGQNPDVNRKALLLCPFDASFKKIPLNRIFIHFFHVFIHVYSPGAGADNSLGSEFLYKHKPFVTLVICLSFFH